MILLFTLAIFSVIVFLFSLKQPNRAKQHIDDNKDVVINEEYIVKQILPTIDDEKDIDHLTSVEQEALNDFLNSYSYSFSFIIENQSESLFQDGKIIKEILSTKENNDYINNVILESGKYIPELMFDVEKRKETSIFELNVTTGNKESNLKISTYYYSLLEQNELMLLKNKNIYLLDNQPNYDDSSLRFEKVKVDPPSDESKTQSRESKQIIIITVIGIVGGLVMGVLVSFLRELFSKRISYIYNYNLKGKQKLINLDLIPTSANISIIEALTANIIDNDQSTFLLVTETKVGLSLKESIKKINNKIDVLFTEKVSNLQESTLDSVDEIVILIELDKTSKNWYEEQLEFLRKYDMDIKVVRLPKIK